MDPVQTVGKDRTNSGNGTTTTVLAVLAATTAHHSLTVHVSVRSGGNNCTGVTDSQGNTYVRIGSSYVSGQGDIIDEFVCLDPVALSTADTITLTFAGSGNARQGIAIEWPATFTAVPSGSAFATGNQGIAASPTPVLATPPDSQSVVIGTISYESNTAPTVDAPFTLWDSQAHTSGSADLVAVAYCQETTASADGPQWHVPTVATQQVVYAISAASSGGGSASFSDSVPLATSLTANEAAARALADAVPLATSLAGNEAAARSLSNSVPLATSVVGQKVVVRSITDAVPLATSSSHTTGTQARSTSDTVPLATSPSHSTAAKSRGLADAVPLSTSLFGQKVSPRAIADVVPLASSLARAAGVKSRGMADGVALSTSLAVRVHLASSMADSLGLATSLVVSGGQLTHPAGSMAGGDLSAPVMAGGGFAAAAMTGGSSVGPQMKGR